MNEYHMTFLLLCRCEDQLFMGTPGQCHKNNQGKLQFNTHIQEPTAWLMNTYCSTAIKVLLKVEEVFLFCFFFKEEV